MGKEIIKKDKKELSVLDLNFLDIYDTQYQVIDLVSVCEEKRRDADNVLQKFSNVLLGKGVLASLRKSETEYVVDMSDEIKKAIDEGLLKLDKGKDGTLYCQLRVNGKYGKKLPIKKVLKESGLDPVQVSNALQMKALESQLNMVINTLSVIGEDLESVREGQQSDRIALLFSGMNLYLEAKDVNDEVLKRYLISQALKGISDANAQVMQQLQADIRYLMTKQYIKKKGNSYEDMQNCIKRINNSFNIVYRSAMIKAAIYYDQEEITALITALAEYQRFIEAVIIPVTPKLTELDDTMIHGDVWEKRAASLSAIEDMKKNLESKNAFQIHIAGPQDEDSDNSLVIGEVEYV